MNDIKKLALRLKNHDENALKQIIIKYTPLVTAIICNIFNGSLSKEDIEETVSDTFVALWKNADNFEPEKLSGYLCTIAKSKAFDRLSKKHIAFDDIDEVDIQDDFSLYETVETKEIARELKKAISTVNEPDREILIRHYFYYQKIEDIAKFMNIPQATVKVKLHRTRKKLKKYLTERGFSL